MKIKFSFVCIAIVYVLGIISCSKEPVIQPESHIIKESIEEVIWISPVEYSGSEPKTRIRMLL